jgi:hypothetical protein
MSMFYYDKAERRATLLGILQTIGLELHHACIKGTNINTDGLCESNPIIILKVKNEIVENSAERSFQALLHYDNFVREYELWKDVSSIHSCFTITLVGKPPSTFFLAFSKLDIGPQLTFGAAL